MEATGLPHLELKAYSQTSLGWKELFPVTHPWRIVDALPSERSGRDLSAVAQEYYGHRAYSRCSKRLNIAVVRA